MKKVSFIGAGNMGSAIIHGICQVIDPANVYIFDPNTNVTASVSTKTGCRVSHTASEAVQNADITFLCVKPQVLPAVLQDLLPDLKVQYQTNKQFTLVSIAAGIQLSTIESILETAGITPPVIRIMPNLCANVGAAVMLVSPGAQASNSELQSLQGMLAPCGLVEIVDEHTLDLGTAISGCAPAFVYMFIEALADGGVQIGLPRAKAQLYAAQTVLGAAKMVLQNKQHPGALKDAVCSPGGSTIAGVASLETHGFRSAASQAVVAAYNRTMELK